MMTCGMHDVFIHAMLAENPLQVVRWNICPSLTTMFANGDLWLKQRLTGPAD